MAIDVYLKLEGIPGDSTDQKYDKQVECTSVHFEVLQPKSATASTAGGHTAERCEHKDIVITKLVDKATPKFLEYCSTGKLIKTAEINFTRAGTDGKRFVYFTIMLKDAIISGIAPSVGEGEVMKETVAIKYRAVKWQYFLQDAKGNGGTGAEAAYDLSKNIAVFG
jgi:type VI secretion system secreted protein Hcp